MIYLYSLSKANNSKNMVIFDNAFDLGKKIVEDAKNSSIIDSNDLKICIETLNGFRVYKGNFNEKMKKMSGREVLDALLKDGKFKKYFTKNLLR